VPAWFGGPASSAANGARLAAKLTLEEATEVFTKAGGLAPEVIGSSRLIIDGARLNNPAVVAELTKDGSRIADWGKYATETFKSPLGEFQVHFYYNKVTRALNTSIDYKVIFK
jgi:hypothetical protein